MAACRPECNTISTSIEYWSSLNMYNKAHPVKLTGLICTLGPTSNDEKTIESMIIQGMNVCRINMWQNSDKFASILDTVNSVCSKLSHQTGIFRTIGIALETCGPEIQVGEIDNVEGFVDLITGTSIQINVTDSNIKGNSSTVFVDCPQLLKVVKPGMKIFLEHGETQLTVREVDESTITVQVNNNGIMRSRSPLNIPGVKLDLPTLSKTDLSNIRYGIDNNADILLASVRNFIDIGDIKEALGTDRSNVMLIAKISTREAIRCIDEIIRACDGILLERGALGIEVAPHKIFAIQKSITARANRAGKPIIISSHFLPSMERQPRPTRAELADITNTVLDGAHSILLNTEVAYGKYPVLAVATASQLCREAETALPIKRMHYDLIHMTAYPSDVRTCTSAGVVKAASLICASAIIVLTTTGKSAYSLASLFPCCPIIAVTRNIKMARRGALYRGVMPVVYQEELVPDWRKDVIYRLKYAIAVGKCEGIFQRGDNVIACYGWRTGPGFTNTMRIINIDFSDLNKEFL